LLVKRDDLTGLTFGGNKLREFEYSVAQAVHGGYDVLVNVAGSQSNHSRLTAAVAAKLGLRCVVVAREDSRALPTQGNLLLCHLLGAEVHLAKPEQHKSAGEAMMQRLAAEGHKPFHTGYDGRVYRSLGYIQGFMELLRQLKERDNVPGAVYLSTGINTHVGLVVAARALGVDMRIVGAPYSPRYEDQEKQARLAEAANEVSELLELGLAFHAGDFETHVEFAGPAQGVLTEAAIEAIDLAARTEGLILDPIYTSKAMACLIADIRVCRYTKGQTVLFLHTGGTPSLFAYNVELGPDV
jgi:1-aminocyclopropane-1-carboxylate deaminase/D-cysteine desulfhydrase-like pyridoxal-dependent ACC family enzyme